ncbi:MAG: tetratricopeptide repeat protein [Candidatus Omnitrophica bacterium]|nr:tetratricopeptide repeat protein [Candidatus Omnitrophota bacterium]
MTKKFLIILSVIIFTALVYLPVFHSNFVNWDDDVHLTHNYYVHELSLQNLKNIFTTTVNGIYIPLTSLSFALEYAVFKDNPVVYHVNNLILHLMVVLFVYFFFKALGQTDRAALIGALIFAWHPMHVESVAWVTERKDVLYSVFYMLALLCYLKYIHFGMQWSRQNPSERGGRLKYQTYLLGVLLCALLSVLSKPMALSLPFILLLCDWFKKRPINAVTLMEKLVIGFMLVPVVLISYGTQAREPMVIWPQSALIWTWSAMFYLRKFFFPDYFVHLYNLPQPVSLSNPVYLASLIGFVLTLLLVVRFRKNRLFIFGLMFYVCSIFFLWRFDNQADANVVADRFMYLPSVGIIMFCSHYIEQFWRKWRSPTTRALCFLALSGLFVFLGVKTFYQACVWQNSVKLWTHQLEKHQQGATALVFEKLGAAYKEDVVYDSLIKAYQTCLRQENRSPRLCMARRSVKLGRQTCYHREAISLVFLQSLFSGALDIKPDFAYAQFHLGEMYFDLGLDELAEKYLMQSLRNEPSHFNAMFYLGQLYRKHDRHEQAIDFYDQALRVNLDNKKVQRDIMKIYDEMSKDGHAGYVQAYQRFLDKYRLVFDRPFSLEE